MNRAQVGATAHHAFWFARFGLGYLARIGSPVYDGTFALGA
jgi:hypothetical protein